ncbi:MAG: aspartate:alanine exchanger family transporter [Actinomycetota bacterium]
MLALLTDSPLLTIMLVLALGAALGAVPFGPLRFGAAGALFVGLAIGSLDPALGQGLGLVQTLGLALFVYTVGIGAGATFFSDLRRQLPLMGLAVGVLAVATALTVAVGKAFGLGTGLIAGTFAGALTSTPALAAATAATGSPDASVGYSLGYPVGVTLAILAIAMVVGRDWPGKRDTPSLASEGIEAVSTRVERTVPVREVPGWGSQEIRMSYLQRGGRTRVVSPGEDLEPGDEVLLVGAPRSVEPAVEFLGRRLDEELTHDRSAVDFRRFVVSRTDLAGHPVAELNLPSRFGGVVTRVRRGDVDLLGRDDLVLQLGDRVLAVVPRGEMEAVSGFFGDSERKVSEVDALALGIGMTLGLLVGAVAVPLPGGAVFSLGSAAGPLVVGMVLGAIHRTGPIAWELPMAANLTTRQLGLLLFLATVGLASGDAFASQAFTVIGLRIALTAAVVLAGAAAVFLAGARLLGLSAPRSAGAFAGFIGQPAILAYATGRVTDERIEAGYAALFALGIIAKILAVQVIAVL